MSDEGTPLPLAGRTVVVTRPRAQAAALLERLEALGAQVVAFPAIRVVAPEDPGPLARAVRAVRSYDWVVLTSANGVERFMEALGQAGEDAGALACVRTACVGPATAAALARHGVQADVVPERFVAEGLDEALRSYDLAGARVLLPVAADARDVLPVALRARGAVVDQVTAYRSVPNREGAAAVRALLDADRIDAITFTSPSTVHSFLAAVGADTGRALIAVIGPVTAAAARSAGWPVAVEAEEHTTPGLVQALVEHLGAGRGRRSE
jgi:uroporphyrinogen III methyltransferase / synthase